SSRRRHTRSKRDWSSDVCSSDLVLDEIQHLKKLIAQQNRQFDSYPPDYQVVFQYLLDQELEEDLAREIVDAVVNKHEEQKDQKAFNEILEDTRLEIKIGRAHV